MKDIAANRKDREEAAEKQIEKIREAFRTEREKGIITKYVQVIV